MTRIRGILYSLGLALPMLLILTIAQGHNYRYKTASGFGLPDKSEMKYFSVLPGQAASSGTVRGEALNPIIYYLSPTGKDTNSGTTPSKPWHSFKFAIPKLRPGDTLILLDGTYTIQSTGLPEIICSESGSAVNGTSTAPITIQAQNERKAFLQSDGSTSALYMRYCSHWRILGLSARSADFADAQNLKHNHVFSIRDSNEIILYRLLGAHNNRYFNSHIYTIDASTNILILECEAYFFHRHGFDVFQSHDVTIRRSYANSRGYEDLPDGYPSDRPGGDESFVLYHSSNSIIENSIAEFETRGFEIHGGQTFDGLPGGRNNKVLGSIHLDGYYGAEVDSREVDGVIRTAGNNLYKDFLVLNVDGSGFHLLSSDRARIENITIYNAKSAGIRAGDKMPAEPFCDRMSGGCSFAVTNSLIFNNGDTGIKIAIPDLYDWLVESSNVFNNGYGDFSVTENISDNEGFVRNSISITPTKIGLDGEQTIVYIPAGSNMKGAGKDGADIGANILYRYENGILTCRPLWNPLTGAFPCGAVVPGVNDLAGSSCFDVHQRLNVKINTLPPNYADECDLVWLPIIVKGVEGIVMNTPTESVR
jgi:hypothetical protein